MSASQSSQDSAPEKRNESSVAELIRLENAKKEAYDAERRKSKQKEKERRSKTRNKLLSQVPVKVLLVVAAVVAAVVVCVPTIILPVVSPPPEPTYLSEAELEEVISVSNISAVE